MPLLILIALCFTVFAWSEEPHPSLGVEEVSPTEDLMREHGVLNRVLLIYDEILRRIETDQPYPPAALKKAAEIVRDFIENYHEKLEEDFIFPRFVKAGKMVDLVETLKKQHQQGRLLTHEIIAHYQDQKIQEPLKAFIEMYRPHEAREDTVLFPAFKELVTEAEYKSLGEQFEDKEDELFGKDGFNRVVEEVAALEKELGIYDLNQFTPQIRSISP